MSNDKENVTPGMTPGSTAEKTAEPLSEGSEVTFSKIPPVTPFTIFEEAIPSASSSISSAKSMPSCQH